MNRFFISDVQRHFQKIERGRRYRLIKPYIPALAVIALAILVAILNYAGCAITQVKQ